MSEENAPLGDPLELEGVDREIRINELEEQAKELGMRSSFVSENCPREVHERFLRDKLHFESGPRSTQFAELVNDGVEMPAPESLDDAALFLKLWEVINTLADRKVFLSRTNHLADRQLYEHLWSKSLREEVTIMPADSGWRNYIDILGGCSEEDMELDLCYYMTEECRQHWAKDFPSDVIPPHEDPPFDRDRLLPREDDEFVDEGGDEDLDADMDEKV